MDLFTIVTARADYEQGALVIIDQTQLLGREVYLVLKTPEKFGGYLFVKGKGCAYIGVAAACGCRCMQKVAATGFDDFYREFSRVKDYLASRPTAVNLFTALERMDRVLLKHQGAGVEILKQVLREEAEAIRDEDADACRKIGSMVCLC
ncbi:MAG: hypothetical protein ACLTZT_05645 [Butyricimonas faecalis]